MLELLYRLITNTFVCTIFGGIFLFSPLSDGMSSLERALIIPALILTDTIFQYVWLLIKKLHKYDGSMGPLKTSVIVALGFCILMLTTGLIEVVFKLSDLQAAITVPVNAFFSFYFAILAVFAMEEQIG